MDTKLLNGDHAAGVGNIPYEISGLEEYLQQAMLCFRVRKGSFRYAPEFGSRLFLVKAGEHERAAALCGEALACCPHLRVRAAAAEEERISVTVETPEGEGTVIIERKAEENGEAEL